MTSADAAQHTAARKPRTVLRRRPSAVAYHESGHALACVKLKWELVAGGTHPAPVQQQDAIELGRVLIRPPRGRVPVALRSAVQNELRRQHLIISLAGAVAQRIGRPRSRDLAVADRSISAVLSASLSVSPKSEFALVKHAEAEARALIRRHWPAVQALAERFDRGMIQGKEIAAIVAQVDEQGAADAAGVFSLADDQFLRRSTRRDVAEGALLVLCERLAAGDEGLRARTDLALQAVAFQRGLSPDELRTRLHRTTEQEAAQLAWRPVPTRSIE